MWSTWDVAVLTTVLGLVNCDLGEHGAAAALFEQSLPLVRELGVPEAMVDWLAGVGTLAAALGQQERAARLFGASDALADRLATPYFLPERAHHERTKQEVRSRLGEGAFARASEEGHALTPDQAIDEAMAAVGAAGAPPAVAAAGGPSDAAFWSLTPRELEILRLIAAGLPDREIAAALSVSPRTVGGHVTSILGKLGVASRAAAAAHAVRQGLA